MSSWGSSDWRSHSSNWNSPWASDQPWYSRRSGDWGANHWDEGKEKWGGRSGSEDAQGDQGKEKWGGRSGSEDAKGEVVKITNTTTLGGNGNHALKREHRLQLIHGVVAACQVGRSTNLGDQRRLPEITTSQWSAITIDSVIFILTRCSPKTPVRSLLLNGTFDCDVCIKMMAEACRSLHREPGLEEVLSFIVEKCYEQVALVKRATEEGFPATDYALSKDTRKEKQDWRQPPAPDLELLTERALTNFGSVVPPRRLTRENTDDELERIEKRRRIAKAKLEEQEALLKISRLQAPSREDAKQLTSNGVSVLSSTRPTFFPSESPRSTSQTPSLSDESIEKAAKTQLALLSGGATARTALASAEKGTQEDKDKQVDDSAGSHGGDNLDKKDGGEGAPLENNRETQEIPLFGEDRDKTDGCEDGDKTSGGEAAKLENGSQEDQDKKDETASNAADSADDKSKNEADGNKEEEEAKQEED